MIPNELKRKASPRLTHLAVKLRDREYRQSYLAHSVRTSIANQIRALRGNRTQTQFAHDIGTTQSVVSRLENDDYGRVNIQTLVDIAQKLDIALLVQFADYPTFLTITDDQSIAATAPQPFRSAAVDALLGAKSATNSEVIERQYPVQNISTHAAGEVRIQDQNYIDPRGQSRRRAAQI